MARTPDDDWGYGGASSGAGGVHNPFTAPANSPNPFVATPKHAVDPSIALPGAHERGADRSIPTPAPMPNASSYMNEVSGNWEARQAAEHSGVGSTITEADRGNADLKISEMVKNNQVMSEILAQIDPNLRGYAEARAESMMRAAGKDPGRSAEQRDQENREAMEQLMGGAGALVAGAAAGKGAAPSWSEAMWSKQDDPQRSDPGQSLLSGLDTGRPSFFAEPKQPPALGGADSKSGMAFGAGNPAFASLLANNGFKAPETNIKMTQDFGPATAGIENMQAGLAANSRTAPDVRAPEQIAGRGVA